MENNENKKIPIPNAQKADELKKDRKELEDAFEKFSSKYGDFISGLDITKMRNFNWKIEIRMDMQVLYN